MRGETLVSHTSVARPVRIRRRFGKSLDYLERIYKPVVDDWYVYDGKEGEFVLQASWKNA